MKHKTGKRKIEETQYRMAGEDKQEKGQKDRTNDKKTEHKNASQKEQKHSNGIHSSQTA